MKRILSSEEKTRKETIKKTIIGLILVGIMILSTAGYAFYGNEDEKQEKFEYRGVEFTRTEGGFWKFSMQGLDFLTEFNPLETENISVPIISTANNFYKQPLYFAKVTPSNQEIGRNLGKLVSRIQEGVCLEENECEENWPLKNCEEDNIIIIKDSQTISITQEDNCIFINAPYDEQKRAADAFLYKVLGV